MIILHTNFKYSCRNKIHFDEILIWWHSFTLSTVQLFMDLTFCLPGSGMDAIVFAGEFFLFPGPVSSCLHIGKILLLLTLHVCSFGSLFGCCCLFNHAVNFIYILCLFLWLLKRFLVSLYLHVANNQSKESL